MGQDAGLRPGVVELVPCQDNGYRDSCGICNGDGSSCSAVATAFVAVLTAMLLGVTIVWIRLWHTQTTFDDRVKAVERNTVALNEVFNAHNPRRDDSDDGIDDW